MTSTRYDLVDLRLFLNIAEAGNLTRGAERSCLSVGAASTRLKNLEESLDIQLFIRRSQGVILTPAGEALLRHAINVLQELERLHGSLQFFSRGLKGQVRIFANTTAMTGVLPEALSSFLATHPQVDIDLEERLSPEIARAVTDGSVDIGILAGNVRTDELEVIPYQKDRLVLAVARSNPLSDRHDIDFTDALSQNFVSLHQDSAIYGFVNQIVSGLGASINIRIKVSSFEALCRMVEADVGVGVLPASVAARLAGSHAIHIVALRDPWAVRELKICVQSLPGLPSFARELVDYLVLHSDPGCRK
ncbi:LysR substrate-binding domain-containing protein [Microvirga brassicacearum]|uniref:LysR family transcriptional regulator n=1 Tax=Microvirga brassicacearum TaxID=2580413 RepID=A0A5N3P6H0_9HYPH|nr:LysR substrate-binding domain-containing protein [Microvirga brassicacearum]KAB0265303.1 LysR family transcriptional regulator [Microvirga brassicacearum]